MPVPIAILVCEGDLKTNGHISEALQNKFPVILMKGSGKAADLVSDYLEKYLYNPLYFKNFKKTKKKKESRHTVLKIINVYLKYLQLSI